MLRKTISLITAMTIGLSPLASISPVFAQQGIASNDYWWPNSLSLDPLRNNSSASDPMGEDFDYAAEFSSVDLDQLSADLVEVMTTSQEWWPADYGHYGPFFIRMAWHSAGTYRVSDGRGGAYGGMQRFAPLNSWPDNANLDKARRLLWPIKQKYGRTVSWGDLMVLAGTVAMDSMGFETYGFAGGRVDAWEAEEVYWGPEGEWLADERYSGDRELDQPLAAVQMGLIYVNPEGPNGNPDPLLAARDIRDTFGRMAMNDEETAALIAGGHTFGKAHGAADPGEYVGVEPEAANIEAQGLGWKNSYGSGNGADTITSGLEGAWTMSPASWTNDYLENLYAYDWVQTKSPAGATQWIPAGGAAANVVPDAHDATKRHAPIMFTTDLALKMDPAYREITLRWLANPEQFEVAFAKAWFKLTHRDMGPSTRYLGSMVPTDKLVWQDPVPEIEYSLVNARDITRLKSEILDSGLTVAQLVNTAWASAATFRATDSRGGANGARIRLAPQKDWDVNQPAQLAQVLEVLDGIQSEFNGGRSSRKISMADLIVLAGSAAIEQAAQQAGYDLDVAFAPGRADATQAQTDVNSFAVLEPSTDGFRNYIASGNSRPPVESLVDRADMLNLTVPEMTVLVGGLRVLDANVGQAAHGVFTDRAGTLSNDFFVNLLDGSTKWTKSSGSEEIYEGRDSVTNRVKWTATPVDLIFGSNSELRAISEVYGTDDADEKFVTDFAAAWTKVMELDRFDL
ncbi:MAG: catalase-peroxidase [Pseudohongiellaceae bacterium]|jgi:catalase-peroxidase